MIKIDKNACIGCGSCCATCPSIFELDNDGLAKVKAEIVSEEEKKSVQEAVENCPVEAIKNEKKS